jgi:glyoxylase-like metal-dependent hydrolase (beta-lactamase superfamily II)
MAEERGQDAMIETLHVEIGHGRPACSMDVLTLGQVRIVRIADIDRIEWPATALFGALTADDLRAAAGAVPAGTVDADAATLLLSFNTYLIQTPDFTALIDAGIGNGKERPDRPAWHRRDGPFLDLLDGLGIRPDAVDIVVNTHLHADHVGWNTVLGDAGWQPTFARARYVAPRAEFDHWNRLQQAEPSTLVLHGAFADSVLPLREADCLELVDPTFEIAPGLRFEPAAGHSPGMCVVRLTVGAASVLFTADVLHGTPPGFASFPSRCLRLRPEQPLSRLHWDALGRPELTRRADVAGNRRNRRSSTRRRPCGRNTASAI